MKELLNISGQNNDTIKNVMVLEAAELEKVAEDLANDEINVKLVEINKDRAEELAGFK